MPRTLLFLTSLLLLTGGAASAATPAKPRVVLSISVAGGFVPYEYAYGTIPELVVYADGTAISPLVGGSAGPVLPRLRIVHLAPAQLASLIARARRAGLLGGPIEYPMPQVTDLPTTTVTIVVNGHLHTHAAYALGFPEKSERGVRKTLLRFVSATESFVLAQGTVVRPRALPARVRLHATKSQGGVTGTVTPWAVDGLRLAAIGECAVTSSPRVIRALAQLRRGARYREHATTYELTMRALLPGDPACVQPSA